MKEEKKKRKDVGRKATRRFMFLDQSSAWVLSFPHETMGRLSGVERRVSNFAESKVILRKRRSDGGPRRDKIIGELLRAQPHRFCLSFAASAVFFGIVIVVGYKGGPTNKRRRRNSEWRERAQSRRITFPLVVFV